MFLQRWVSSQMISPRLAFLRPLLVQSTLSTAKGHLISFSRELLLFLRGAEVETLKGNLGKPFALPPPLNGHSIVTMSTKNHRDRQWS